MKLNFSCHKSRRCHFVFPFFSFLGSAPVHLSFPPHTQSLRINFNMDGKSNVVLCCAINERCQLPFNLSDVMLPDGRGGCETGGKGNQIFLWDLAFGIGQVDFWCSEFICIKEIYGESNVRHLETEALRVKQSHERSLRTSFSFSIWQPLAHSSTYCTFYIRFGVPLSRCHPFHRLSIAPPRDTFCSRSGRTEGSSPNHPDRVHPDYEHNNYSFAVHSRNSVIAHRVIHIQMYGYSSSTSSCRVIYLSVRHILCLALYVETCVCSLHPTVTQHTNTQRQAIVS